jgi:hypothetical protein
LIFIVKNTQLQNFIIKIFWFKKIDFALNSSDNQNKESVITFNLYKPYKPKYEKKNQLKITVEKNSAPK